MKRDHMGTDPANPSPQELSLPNWTRFSKARAKSGPLGSVVSTLAEVGPPWGERRIGPPLLPWAIAAKGAFRSAPPMRSCPLSKPEQVC